MMQENENKISVTGLFNAPFNNKLFTTGEKAPFFYSFVFLITAMLNYSVSAQLRKI